MEQPYKRYFKKQEELISSNVPQSVRPEHLKKVVKIGSVAKVDIEDEEDEDEDIIEEDLLKNKDERKEILDCDTKELLLKQKNKSI